MNKYTSFTNTRSATTKGDLRYPIPEDRVFNRVISDISVVQRETTLTISDSIETASLVGSEILRVVSPSTTKITEITRFKKKKKKRSSVPGYLNVSLWYIILWFMRNAFAKSIDSRQPAQSAQADMGRNFSPSFSFLPVKWLFLLMIKSCIYRVFRIAPAKSRILLSFGRYLLIA